MRGVARGARRPKSRFGAALELLSHVRVWFYERETRELVRITECELLDSFLAAQSDYGCGVALSLLSEISEAALPEREASDAAFRLLLLAARRIDQTRRPFVPLVYFSLWTMRLAGWLPDLGRCTKCSRSFGEEPAFFVLSRPGLLCANCRIPGSSRLSPQALALARRMLLVKPGELAEPDSPSPHGRELLAYLLDSIEQHIERKLAVRRMLEFS
jgi:DNA repair protein RecO (recombination protein O)